MIWTGCIRPLTYSTGASLKNFENASASRVADMQITFKGFSRLSCFRSLVLCSGLRRALSNCSKLPPASFSRLPFFCSSRRNFRCLWICLTSPNRTSVWRLRSWASSRIITEYLCTRPTVNEQISVECESPEMRQMENSPRLTFAGADPGSPHAGASRP